ncbi:MAG: glycerol-3-phosphate transporter [Flavobacteriaceae bacterium]|nr:glycerol-3-phosphate transporter [Flavobacteriaceae bacterium]
MFKFLKQPLDKEPISNDKVDKFYSKMRWQVFFGIFVGYAGYYLVRKNFALAIPDLIEQGYTKLQLGFALSGVAIAYGLSKFLMGNVSDRSDARKFMPIGLLMSGLIMITMGLFPFATSSVTIMFILLLLNGWFQGMGWPPSGRIMVQWFSIKERGTKMSFWNTAHNIGGGLIGPLAIFGVAYFNDWHAKFYLPGIIAVFIALIIYLTLRDRPQAVGLPPIEEYKNDYPEEIEGVNQNDIISGKEIFLKYIFKNKLLWFIAIANIFVYLVRYGILDWAPTYLKEVKNFSLEESGWAYFLYEWAGIPGTILAGIVSDKWFKGKRAPVSIIYMVLVLIAVVVYWKNPVGNPLIDNLALIAIGFLIYGPVMLIGVQALDLVPKNAAGTAAGFTGLFGYLGGALTANIVIGYLVDNYGWDSGFLLLVGACILSILFIGYTWIIENKNHKLKELNKP